MQSPGSSSVQTDGEPRFSHQTCFSNVVQKSFLCKSHFIFLLGSMIPVNFLWKSVCQ